MKTLILAAAALAVQGSSAYAQRAPDASLDSRAPPATMPTVEPRAARCEDLAGKERQRCQREEQRRSAGEMPGASGTGSCDALYGPDKQLCLREGGTVTTSGERSTPSSGGGSRPAPR